MKTIVFIIYIIFLLIAAVLSVISTWANDPYLILILELYVDVIFISGCVIYTFKKYIKYWWVVFFIAIGVEIFLLIYDPGNNIKILLFWVIALSPALYLNFKLIKKFNS